MSDDDAFVEQIRRSPFDEANRLVYADWLQERDDPRAEFVRVEFALAALILVKKREDPLAARYLDLSLAFEERWVTAVDRIPGLLRPSVKDGDRYTLTPRRGETMMFLLSGLFGAPRDASNLSQEEMLCAVTDRRLLGIDWIRDGYGGGTACVYRHDRWADWTNDGDFQNLVFPPGCTVTDAVFGCLCRNNWERASEVFEPR